MQRNSPLKQIIDNSMYGGVPNKPECLNISEIKIHFVNTKGEF